MTYDLVIKGGSVVTAGGVFVADVAIDGETIVAVGRTLAGKRELDAAGLLVTPGGIDLHVHLQYKVSGTVTCDDFYSGTRAAALGGTTAIVDFVESAPEQSLLEALEARRAEATGRAVIDFGLHMTIKPEDVGKLDQIEGMVEAGCPSFKHYMAYGFALNDGELLKSFEAIARAGGIAIVHAENWDVIQALIAQNLAMGRTGPEWHPRSRPPQFEAQAAGRAIDLAEFSGVPLHIFHVSTGLVVERVAAARSRGLPVYAETCPQYLLLDDSVFERPGEEGGLSICSPPIRTRREQNELWAALGRGQLQVVSTDHAPFTREQKRAGLGDYSKTPGGVPGIQSRMMLLYTYGVRTGRMSLPQFAACCAATPARIMGFSRKGQIAAGFDADIAVLDPEKEMILSTETLQETSGWSPYEGLAVRGVPRYTISRGELIVEDGEFRGQEGWGQFVRRQRPRLSTSKIDTSATH